MKRQTAISPTSPFRYNGAVTPYLLVVAEEPQALDGLCAALREGGYEVRGAGDAPSAGRRLRSRLPDLVVVDVTRPYMPALELVAELFSDPSLPLVPALFLTSNPDFAAHAEDLGAEFLAKPVEARELLRAVARCLRRRGEADAPLGYESAFPVCQARLA